MSAATIPVAAPVTIRQRGASGHFYVPELDTLRFFAFFVVFIDHIVLFRWMGFLTAYGPLQTQVAAFIHQTGALGVDLFFCLSAYLITELLMREKERFGRLDVRSFYLRRILRIWPLYFTFLISAFTLMNLYPTRWAEVPWLFFVGALILMGNFATIPFHGVSLIAGPLWSVSIEEQFYLSWPLFVKASSKRGITLAAVALWAFSICFRWCLWWQGFYGASVWYDTLARLDPIACGILLSALTFGQASRQRFRRHFLLAGITLWAIAGYFGPSTNPGFMPVEIGYIMAALGCGAFVLAIVGAGTSHPWVRNAWLVYLGKISYGLYVFHGGALILSAALFWSHPSWLYWLEYPIVAAALTFALASASYRWFETPFLRLKRRFEYVPSRGV